jgi:TonB family protein
MKRCPVCQRVYEDEMGYCLEDGSGLMNVSESSSDADAATVRIPASRLTNQSPTEILPAGGGTPPEQQFSRQHYASDRTAPPERKPSVLPWIIGALILGLSGIAIALILTRSREPDNSQLAQNTSQSANTTPTFESSNTTTGNPYEMRENAPPRAGETPGRTPEDRVSVEAAPMPKLTPTPRSATSPVVVDDPPPPPRPTPTTAPERRGPISGGVLNGKAISLPRPTYPPVARAARAAGTVTVQVTIDESGKVISARAVGGHPLLQQAAVQAAYGARFSPTQLSGQAVKVTGVLTYNFVAQ